MSQILLYRDENEEAHEAGRDAVEALKPGFRDKVGFRNARYFRPNEVEPADTVVIVGSWPELIKAYEGREGVDVVLVDLAPAKPVEAEAESDEPADEKPADEPKSDTADASEPESETPKKTKATKKTSTK